MEHVLNGLFFNMALCGFSFKEDMNLPKLSEASLIIFGSPREKFSTVEVFWDDSLFN